MNATDLDERREMIVSFGNLQNSADIELYLNKTSDDATKLSKADRVSIIQSISGGSQTGLKLTIAFLNTNLVKVNSTIGSIPTILTSIANNIVTTEVETEVVLFQLLRKPNIYSIFSLLYSVVLQFIGSCQNEWTDHRNRS